MNESVFYAVSVFVMGKNIDEEQNLPGNDEAASARNNGGRRCSCAWISRCFSLRCVLILAFSAAVFLSALFWLPPFLGLTDRGDLDLDPRFKGKFAFSFALRARDFPGARSNLPLILICGTDLGFLIRWVFFSSSVFHMGM